MSEGHEKKDLQGFTLRTVEATEGFMMCFCFHSFQIQFILNGFQQK